MSVHTAYEVRVYRDDDWHIEAVLDEESLAVAAAKKLEVRLQKIPVVVVQEIYDAARNHLKSRSVYRSAPAVRPAPSAGAAKTASRTPSRPTGANDGPTLVQDPQPAVVKAEGAGSQVSWALFGLLLAAIATYVALRSFTG